MKIGDVATWCTAAAELVIAGVIYLELKANRDVAFLEEANADKFHANRIEIYHSYLGEDFHGSHQETRKDLWLRSRKFDEKISGDTELTSLCQLQNTHLSKVACLYGRRHFRHLWRFIEKFFPDSVVEWFPSAVVTCWIILAPYILKRASSIGPYWSAPLVNYTLACLNFILRDKDAQIVLYRKPGENLIISKSVLSEIREELEMLRKIKSRLEMKKTLDNLDARYNWIEKTAG